MNSKNPHTYVAIDLKSFYASSECADRCLDPLTTNLVVADLSRTEKTICLAVSPSLKAYGIPGRARLFEVIQKVKAVNAKRLIAYRNYLKLRHNPDYKTAQLGTESFNANALASDPSAKLGYIVAPPRMQRYEDVSSLIYSIYLKYVSAEDIIVYSIDEIFADVTNYLDLYRMTAHELAMTMIREVLYTTGITATAGIGTNLFLAKVAMDIVAKHCQPDKDGVRIAELNEQSFREQLWDHAPITDFWRVGSGYCKKLATYGMYTMGDVALCSVGLDPSTGRPSNYYSEDFLFQLFGVNAEVLIDHAWGREPCDVEVVKNYRSDSKSISSGQVLKEPYNYEKTKLIVKEMTDLLVLDLVKKGLMTDQIILTVCYDRESLTRPGIHYTGPIVKDHYGRPIPKHAHGTANLKGVVTNPNGYTSSTVEIMKAAMALFEKIVNKDLLSRRINIVAGRVKPAEEVANEEPVYEQLDIFTDYAALEKKREEDKKKLEEEHNLQLALLKIKSKYGKNAILKGMNLEEGGTTIERNGQIGGHRSG